MQQQEVFSLPSGKSVTLRRPGAAAVSRANEAHNDNARAIRLVVECVIEPKIWADTRTELERQRHPITVPDSYQDIDDVLDYADFLAVSAKIGEWVREAHEAAAPFLKTVNN